MNKAFLGHDIPKLGFGLMRLPMRDGAVDMDHLKSMTDAFMKAGFTYFDTAFGYVGGRSEVSVREAVVSRYPRESFQLATKFPIWEVKTESDKERIINTQLERTGAGYFDFYLIHAIGRGSFEKLDSFGIWDFVKQLKQKGIVKHIGFSFHDDAEALDEALTAHPETEFVQLQLNYIDWESDDVQARKCYEVCMKHEKPVIVMEPVKGGMLAGVPEKAKARMESVRPNRSAASWAMRYCASLEGIITVLSGMSNIEQMEDNIRTMSPFEPLTDADRQVIDDVLRIIKEVPTIPCTDCKYCVEKCPQNINIPGIIRIQNDRRVYGDLPNILGGYHFAVGKGGKASDCIGCGVCESRCPQHIGIIETLEDAAKAMG